MNPLCYINSEFLPYKEISLHISDLSIHRAYAVFDFMAQIGHNIPYIDSYLERFINSATLMHLEVPQTKEKIKEIIFHIVKENKYNRSGIKLLLTGGYSDDGYIPGKPNFIIINTPLTPIDPTQYINGVSLMSLNYKRSLPLAKTIDYSVSLTYYEKMRSQGSTEILYIWENKILEASRCNFFLLKNNILITPKENVLHGITREKVIELAKQEHTVEERDIEFDELFTADSCFITSTTKRILPVVMVDAIKINRGQVHPVVKFLMGEFNSSFVD